jgi:mono/diheme cytochrome c family protein
LCLSAARDFHFMEDIPLTRLILITVALLAAGTLGLYAQGGRGGRGASGAPAGGGGRGVPGGQAGPSDKRPVDTEAADRGRTIYVAECVTCHGAKARGASEQAPADLQGPDLVRSVVVLHDVLHSNEGSQIGPFLKKGHPMQSGRPGSSVTDDQARDLAQFLKQRLYDTLNRGPGNSGNPAPNIVTGDATAGAAYFNGAGKCNSCHSPTGDLAGIATRFDPVTVQQRFLFPSPGGGRGGGRGAAPAAAPVAGTPAPKVVTWTVTLADGTSYTGTAIKIDDFDVKITDAAGEAHAWTRTPEMKLVKHDPFAAHSAMLQQYTDKNIHDVVAYLETLK